MPSFMEKKLKDEYSDLPEDERDHAVYGTENKMGFMHGNKITAKGEAAQRHHEMHAEPDADERGGPSDQDADDMPDAGEGRGFMAGRPSQKRKRGFMQEAEMEGHA